MPRPVPRCYPGVSIVLIAVALMPAPPAAAQAEAPRAESDQQDALDRRQTELSNVVRRAANRIDNFFSNERSSWQNNQTRLTLRGNLDWLDEHGWEASPGVRLQLALPGLNDRLRFIVNDDDDEEISNQSTGDEQESNAALRFVAKAAQNLGVSFDLGVSTRGDPAVQGFARANLFRSWRLTDHWEGRLENRTYWYTDSGWRNDFRWYFERRINERLFFRSRTQFDFQEDKDSQVFPGQRFTLFHELSERSVLAYELIAEEVFFDDSPFDADEILKPDDRFTHLQARLRFRQNTGYPWLFYEVWPIAAWAEERDYEFTPAIRLRLEVILGDTP